MKPEKIKLGVLGCYRGADIVKGISESGVAVLRAICDKREDRIASAKETLSKDITADTLVFSSYDEMLASDIDAVLVATDAPLHVTHVLMALEAGKHVLSEIPTVYSIEEAKLLKDAVLSHPELTYMAGENCCFWENIRTMKKMYDDGKLGEIVYAESEYLHCERTPEQYKPYDDPDYWRARLPAIRYLTHNLGPLLYILDDEVETASCYVPDFDQNKYKTEKGVGVALFKTKKGAVIRILICFGAYVGCNHGFSLYGSHGTIITDRTKSLSTAHCFAKLSEFPESRENAIEIPVTISGGDTKASGNGDTKSSGHGGADYKMLLEFIRCIRSGERPALDVDFGIRMSLPGIIAEQSYKNGNAALPIPKI